MAKVLIPTNFDNLSMATRQTVPTIGVDTEFWVERKVDGDWVLVPAFEAGLVRDKGQYKSVSTSGYGFGSGGAYGNDGILAELATDYGGCRQGQVSYIQDGITAMAREVQETLGGKYGDDFRLSIEPVIREFDPEWLASLPEQYQVLGCAPSLNAFGEEYRAAPEDSEAVIQERTLGTHFHLGVDTYRDDHPNKVLVRDKPDLLVRMLELFVNIPLTWFWQKYQDELALRRETYGEAGCYRKKSYGIEWRALPALALQSPQIYHMVAGMVRNVYYTTTVISNFQSDELEERIWDELDMEEIIEIINLSDAASARDIFEAYEDDFRAVHTTGRLSIGASKRQWDLFKFMADNPDIRYDDFNEAWKVPQLVSTSEVISKYNNTTVSWSASANYSLYGGLSEAGFRNFLKPQTKSEKALVASWLSSRGAAKPVSGFRHKSCGHVLSSLHSSHISMTKKESGRESISRHAFLWCPGCNTVGPRDDWNQVRISEGVY